MSENPEITYDVVIVGGGPGGLTAGLYAARSHLKTLLLEKGLPGGQVLMTWKMENYPGFAGGTGMELAAVMEKQARTVGCEIRRAEATDLVCCDEAITVVTDGGTLATRSVIVAAGARPNQLGVPGEKDYTGRGVSYCATCDAAFFQGMPVAVVGGGDTAVEEAIYLTKFASHVWLIHRRDRLRAVKFEQEELFRQPNVTVVWDTVVEEILGDAAGVTGLRLKNVKTWAESTLPVQGVFVFVGITPNSGFLKGKVDMDQWGFIRTDEECRTSLPMVYAVGDIRAKSMRQVANAVGEGATAAYLVEKSLKSY